MDTKRFATDSLIGVVAGLVVFFVTYLIMAPSSLEKQINELANRTSKLEGQFQMFIDLRNDFQNLQKDVSTVQTELGITPPARGRIISPSQDSRVSSNFTYEVEINNPKPDEPEPKKKKGITQRRKDAKNTQRIFFALPLRLCGSA